MDLHYLFNWKTWDDKKHRREAASYENGSTEYDGSITVK